MGVLIIMSAKCRHRAVPIIYVAAYHEVSLVHPHSTAAPERSIILKFDVGSTLMSDPNLACRSSDSGGGCGPKSADNNSLLRVALLPEHYNLITGRRRAR